MLTRLRGQRGFSLVELMVVMVLLGVVGTIVVASIVSGTRSVTLSQARIDALNDLQKGMDRIGRELRAADPIVLDSSGDYTGRIGAEVTRGGEHRRYTYYLADTTEGTELRQDVETLDADGTVLTSRTGLFITSIANTEVSPPVPLFTYYDGEGTAITCDDLDLSTTTGQNSCRDRHLTAAQVRFAIARGLPTQDPIMLQTVVNIRNTRYPG